MTARKEWAPWNEVLRNHNWFVYSGNIPNTPAARKGKREFVREQGRKVVFVPDRAISGSCCTYVSEKFYPSLCKTLYPAYGTGIIKTKAKRETGNRSR